MVSLEGLKRSAKPMFKAEAHERQRGGQGGVLLVANLPRGKSRGSAEKAEQESLAMVMQNWEAMDERGGPPAL